MLCFMHNNFIHIYLPMIGYEKKKNVCDETIVCDETLVKVERA